jgi:prepilin-type N-terminal cleavage/methylation domain-containing protein
MTQKRRDESGFTLIEVLLAVAILSVIAVPLTMSLIAGLRTTKQANAQLRDGNAAALLSVFLAPDVQNVDQAHAGGPVALNGVDCRGGSNTSAIVFYHGDGSNVGYNSELVSGQPALVRRSSATSCARQLIAPGLASNYTFAEGGNLHLYCGTLTGACNGAHDGLRRVTVDLSTPTGYHVQYGATTRT